MSEQSQGADFTEVVERSSLGTPAARAARESVSDEQAARVVQRARQIEQQSASIEPLVAALFVDPQAVVTEAQVRAVSEVYSTLVARLGAVECMLDEFEKAARAAPHHAYAGPWLAMVDDIRRVAFRESDTRLPPDKP